MLREQTPFEVQREIVLARDAGRCWGEVFFPGHQCTDRYGMPSSARETAHVLPKHGLGNYIDGLLLNPRMVDHPLHGADKDAVLYDPRCALTLCYAAHDPWDNKGLSARPFFTQLPSFVHEWAREWGIIERLMDHYA